MSARSRSSRSSASAVTKSARMKRVWHGTSAASAAKRSSATGSRSTPIRVPAGPSRSAIRRAWPPPPTVQSTAVSPGRGSSSSISSPASTGMWVLVMSSSVAKARRDVGDSGQNVFEVQRVAPAVPHLEALAGAGDHDLLVESGVAHQVRRDHHSVGGVELGVEGGVEEEALELAGLRRGRVEPGERGGGEGVVGLGCPDRRRCGARPAPPRGRRPARPRWRAPRETSRGWSAGAWRRARDRRFRGRSRVLIQLTEFKTRVAGWEEPCHPGSACVAHSIPPPPTMQPNSHSLSH